MNRAVVFVVPGDAGNLAPNQRMGWRKERRLEKEWRWRAWAAWTEAGRPRFEARVRICFIVRRGRALDEDNAAGSRALKAIVDGLKDRRMEHGKPLPVIEERMIPDDTPAWVERGAVIQQIGREWKLCAEVVVTVEVLE